MKLIVGLGNPGERYEKTRHNLGFVVVDKLLKDLESVKNSVWDDNKKFKSDIFVFDWQPKNGKAEKIILAKPKTFMNNSGQAVSIIASFYKIAPQDIWIVHDELDLPLGMMKIRLGGAAAGHHGVESILESLKTDKFWRFRLGIGESRNHQELAKHKTNKATEFVVDVFNPHETGKVKQLIKKTVQALSLALERDLATAMNRFN